MKNEHISELDVLDFILDVIRIERKINSDTFYVKYKSELGRLDVEKDLLKIKLDELVKKNVLYKDSENNFIVTHSYKDFISFTEYDIQRKREKKNKRIYEFSKTFIPIIISLLVGVSGFILGLYNFDNREKLEDIRIELDDNKKEMIYIKLKQDSLMKTMHQNDGTPIIREDTTVL